MQLFRQQNPKDDNPSPDTAVLRLENLKLDVNASFKLLD